MSTATGSTTTKGASASATNPAFQKLGDFMSAFAAQSGSSGLIPGENGALLYASSGQDELAMLCAFTRLNRDATREQVTKVVEDAVKEIKSLIAEGKREEALQLLIDLVKMIFFQRDPRSGKGEKKIFYRLFIALWNHFPQTTIGLLPLIPQFGYFKDFMTMYKTFQEEVAQTSPGAAVFLRAIVDGLVALVRVDLAKIQEFEGDYRVIDGQRLSLVCKWLPREGKHHDKTCTVPVGGEDVPMVQYIASRFLLPFPETLSDTVFLRDYFIRSNEVPDDKKRKRFRYMMHTYRLQVVGALMAAFGNSQGTIPEVVMCDPESKWDESIKLEKTPATALKNYMQTFLNKTKKGATRSEREDRVRLAEVIRKDLAEGKIKKLNAAGIFPHELYKKFSTCTDPAELELLTGMWLQIEKNLRRKITVQKLTKSLGRQPTDQEVDDHVDELGHTDGIPVSDVSGSMDGIPMEVSVSLGVLWARLAHSNSPFKDKVITFTDNPQIIDLKEQTLPQMFNTVRHMPWGMSTNIEKTMQLMIDLCSAVKMTNENVAQLSLIIFTDGQFNQMTNHRTQDDAMFTELQRMWTAAGFNSVPRILFWNLRSAPGAPVTSKQKGVTELSGFSANSFDVAMTNAPITETIVVETDGSITKVQVADITPEDMIKEILAKPDLDPIGIACYSLLKTNGEFGHGPFPIIQSLEQPQEVTPPVTTKIPAATSETQTAAPTAAAPAETAAATAAPAETAAATSETQTAAPAETAVAPAETPAETPAVPAETAATPAAPAQTAVVQESVDDDDEDDFEMI
uniref:DUF7788 domain-containing protein n=1 Tax=viral metagenome TaxID=1070528 RepID=A0A6C0E8K5_9ZZZZ